MSMRLSQPKSLNADADGTWKEKLQVYAKQVVLNSHISVLPCILVDAS